MKRHRFSQRAFRQWFTMSGLLVVLSPSLGFAQTRQDLPDRGVYQPPVLRDTSEPHSRYERSFEGLVEVVIDDDGLGEEIPAPPHEFQRNEAQRNASSPIQRVSHQDVILRPARPSHPDSSASSPVAAGSRQNTTTPSLFDAAIVPAGFSLESGCQGCDGCDGCSGIACDALPCEGLTCDGVGCDSCSSSFGRGRSWQGLTNASLCFDPGQWFSSAEVLLMFRSGDRLPPLVTTGAIGATTTRVLFGDDTYLKDMTAGGRVTIGTWLDTCRDRSLTVRGWFAGEESFGFHADQSTQSVIARPFFDVTDGVTAGQDAQIVATPDRASGFVDVRGDSNIYGADVAVRQLWYGGYGGTVDVLYGYQYLRLKETLGISNTSISLDDDFAPLGAVISVADSFEANNEFHGGQLGISSRYRERCWSFDGLLKVAFGQVRREAQRSGSTVTSIDAATAVNAEGLLVRDTNRGTVTDHTFGWVPELDVSIGWRRFPNFDVTAGYHLIVMTEALQTSGMIDRNLASNLASPPTGEQRPAPDLNFDTFYIQGVHFGLAYVY